MPKRIELDIDQIVKRYRAGESAQVIADCLKVSIGTIHKRLKRAGVVKRPVGRPLKYNEAEVCRLYKSDLPITEIMKRMGIGGSSMLYSILNRNGVALRNVSGIRKSVEKEDTGIDAMPQHPPTVARKSFIALMNRVDMILMISPDRSDAEIADICGCLPLFVARQRQFWRTLQP